MQEDVLAPDQAEIDNYQETDIFAWANNLVQYKDELSIELFLINKNSVLYKMTVSKELRKQLEPFFIDGILEYVMDGVDNGLIIRGFEKAASEEMVLQRTQVFKVERAREALNWIKYQEREIEVFKDSEHDFTRMRGIIARISHPELKQPAYAIKALTKSNSMGAKVGWMIRDGKFIPFDADAVVRIPQDNQLLILEQDIYVFNESRLKQLFGYDAKEASIAEQKIAEIEANFQITYAEGMNLQKLIAGSRSAIKKLQKINPHAVKQQEMLDHAEELDINLMADDSGAIIMMDKNDANKFVNLLNDDYMESPLTGQRYEIVRKRLIKPDKEEQV
jgi:hypothetical protein